MKLTRRDVGTLIGWLIVVPVAVFYIGVAMGKIP